MGIDAWIETLMFDEKNATVMLSLTCGVFKRELRELIDQGEVHFRTMFLEGVDKASPLGHGLANVMNGGLRAAAIVDDLLTLGQKGGAVEKHPQPQQNCAGLLQVSCIGKLRKCLGA